MSKRTVKGIGLLSGGLDSTLAAKVLQEQGIEVLGLTFVTPFFGAEPAMKAGKQAGIPVRALDISERHLEMLRKPQYGYGSQMNPCIDCHGLMLREAGRVMEEEGADFLFTGEVMGQRPMSQRRDSMRSVEKLSGYVGRVLRPLSAKHLPPTEVETEGLVDRERLLDIHGRSRKRQAELADYYGIKEYPQPGGGCLLTKEGFANKLKNLMEAFPEVTPREIEHLKWGRHFRLPGNSICTLGRNRIDNERLESMAAPTDMLLRVSDFPSPTGLLLVADESDIPFAARLLVAYSDAPVSESVRVSWKRHGQTGSFQEPHEGRDVFKACQI
ncbi:MAG: tRNA 4-thiouridine(8) synthase ThiI [Acidobacteriota bacterium]